MEWSEPRPGHRRSPGSLTSRRTLRLATIVTALAAMLVAYIVVVTTRANAAETLLSQGRPTTASSTENAGTPAAARPTAIPAPAGRAPFSDPQWLQVDLGASPVDHRVALNWEAAYATAFQIQTSADGTTWTNIYTTTTGTGGTQTPARHRHRPLRADERRPARHRLRRTRCGSSRSSAAPATRPGRLRHHQCRPGQAGHRVVDRERRHPGGAAFDGNTGTRWSSAFSDPQWLQVDLGAAAADLRGEAELGGRLRDRVPDPDVAPTARTWTTSTARPPAPAASRPST